MLEEPRAHDVGGVFGKNPPLVFGLLVFAVQQGRQVHVYLSGGEKEEQMVQFGYCCRRNKGDKSYAETPPSVTMVTEFEFDGTRKKMTTGKRKLQNLLTVWTQERVRSLVNVWCFFKGGNSERSDKSFTWC